MSTLIRQILAPPVFDGSEERTRVARLLHTFVIIILGVEVLFSIGAPLLSPAALSRLILTVPFLVPLIVVLILTYRGQTEWASVLLVGSAWVALTLMAVEGGGVRTPAFSSYILLVLLTGLLLGTRASLGVAALSIVAGLAMEYAVEIGVSPSTPPGSTAMSVWFSEGIELVAAAVILHLAINSVNESLGRARHELVERKRTDAALQTREAYLQAIMNNVPYLMWLKDPDGRFLAVNNLFARSCGRDKAEDVIGKTDLDVWPADLANKYRADDAEVMATLEQKKVEEPIPDDHTIKWFETFKIPILDHQGQLVGTTGIAQDITERKRAEQSLRESEVRYRSLFENMLEGFAYCKMLFDEQDRPVDFVYLDVNSAFARLTGLGNVVGKRVTEVIPEIKELNPELFEIYGRVALTSKPERFELDLKPLARWQSISVYSAEKGTFVAVFDDITERKLADERLRESEDRFRTFVENTSEWILMTDEQGTVVEWNRGAEQITGLERAGVIGKPLWDVQYQLVSDEHKSPALYERLKATYAQILRTGTSLITNRVVEAQFRRGDGIVRVAEQRLFPISTTKGIRLSGIARDVTERKNAEGQIRRQLERLAGLHSIDTAISSSFDLRVTLDILLGQVTTQLGVDAADVLLLDPITHTLKFAVGRGFHSQALQHTHLRLGEGNAGRVALERRVIGIPDVAKDTVGFIRSPRLAQEGFMAYFGAPLIVKGEVKGVLEIFHRAALTPDQEWLDFLEALATQAAIAIDNVTLFDNLQRSNFELETAYDATLEGWSRAMDLRDQETEGHSMRVTTFAVELAHRMGLRDEELVNIRRGALLHDIGKMGIPDQILLKPGALTNDEWTIMRKHPEYAYALLSPIAYLSPVLDVPYCHHEKWDGSGYPRGLKGEQIPLAARIFAIVDVWDAVRSDRPYRATWSVEMALDYIRTQAGKHFDPKVVEAFLEMVHETPEISKGESS